MRSPQIARQIPARGRREFLRFLAGSPLVALPGVVPGILADLYASERRRVGGSDVQESEFVLKSADQALDVMEFEAAARKALPPAHFGYLATGVDDDGTRQANHAAYARYEIRPRRLAGAGKIDTSVRLLGTTWKTPIVLCPVGSQRAFHPEGEIAVARAARAKEHLQILSTVTNSRVEDVIAARGAPVWYQLYVTDVWEVARGLVKRAEAAGCPVVAVTVDLPSNSNRETAFRSRRVDTRQCSACHEPGLLGQLHHAPMFDGLDVSKVTRLDAGEITWDFIKRLKDASKMKVFLKGIVTREDAEVAVLNGVDGVIVSNHGGRAEESLRSTLESLPEVVGACAGKIPVMIDGGIRRGTDIFKALALGATAVGIGRPYAWGLAAFGQPGVEAVLDILTRELATVMKQAGTTSVAQITKNFVAPRPA
jgi:isopentenyl diphosphate isomerase/L-lactate dehydrogenase-like FMN-dependent dehydrogenase